MQGTWVQSLVWEDAIFCEATKPMGHSYRSPSALEPVQQEKPPQQEAQAPQLETARLQH